MRNVQGSAGFFPWHHMGVALVLLLWCLHPAASSPGRETSSHYPQMPCEPGHCPQGPASSLREGQHSALAHNEYYLWNHKMKRCDMQRPFFEGPHGAPWYTEGRWVPSYEERRSVLEYMPMDCVESTAACPSGGCCPSEYGCTPGATSSPLEVCQSYHAPCFESRSGNTFSQNLRNFAFVWQPSDSCYFSSLTVTPPAMWHQYAASIEEAAGPIFFVGDTPLSELFIAFQHHTNGAVHSDFQYTNTLVNSYTLRPMTPKQVEKCATPDSGGTLPTHADAITPCPPSGRSGLPYEVNTHHRLHNMCARARQASTTRPAHSACARAQHVHKDMPSITRPALFCTRPALFCTRTWLAPRLFHSAESLPPLLLTQLRLLTFLPSCSRS